MSYMRVEFEKILANYGHDIFLQRRTQLTDSVPEYSDTLEVHTVRNSLTSSKSLTTTQNEVREGLINTSERVYYFKADVNPYEGDRIYEVDFRNENKQTVWVIDQSYPMRGLGAEIVYWIVGVTRIRPN